MKQEARNDSPTHKYDLEERTLCFARDVRFFIGKLLNTISNIEDGKQLVRSSGSVGANYREANDCLSKKDFALRIRIARKEAKESIYWLLLITIENNAELQNEQRRLTREATELMKILSAILQKASPVSAFHS